MEPSQSYQIFTFEALYRINPLTPIDLISLSTDCKVGYETEQKAKEVKRLHEQIRAIIEEINGAYKENTNKNRKGIQYQLSDLIQLHLMKERFHTKRKDKLISRGDRPFKLRAKVGAIAQKLELSGDVTIYATFNVGDLSPYVE